MADVDFDLIKTTDSGETAEPEYDTSTHTVKDPDAKGKREPSIMESVEAAVAEQRDRDPTHRRIRTLEKNGRSLDGLLEEVEEFDNISRRDPIDGHRYMAQKFGHDPRVVGQYLTAGQNLTGAAAEFDQHQINQTIADFDRKHPDHITKSLRPAAVKILSSGDKRLKDCKTYAETLDRAFGIAWHESQHGKAASAPAEALDRRDMERNERFLETAKVKAEMKRRLG
jgi:hypothetical protein